MAEVTEAFRDARERFSQELSETPSIPGLLYKRSMSRQPPNRFPDPHADRVEELFHKSSKLSVAGNVLTSKGHRQNSKLNQNRYMTQMEVAQ